MERMSGIVKWFSDKKGYGFITPDGQGETAKDIFVHYSDIEGSGYRTLHDGDRVEFTMAQSDRGPKATAIKVQSSNHGSRGTDKGDGATA